MGASELAPGEAEIAGASIKVTVDGFLRRVFARGGEDFAQVAFPFSGGNGYQVVEVSTRLVKVVPGEP